jgi:hypothetical protein
MISQVWRLGRSRDEESLADGQNRVRDHAANFLAAVSHRDHASADPARAQQAEPDRRAGESDVGLSHIRAAVGGAHRSHRGEFGNNANHTRANHTREPHAGQTTMGTRSLT